MENIQVDWFDFGYIVSVIVLITLANFYIGPTLKSRKQKSTSIEHQFDYDLIGCYIVVTRRVVTNGNIRYFVCVFIANTLCLRTLLKLCQKRLSITVISS